MQFSKVMSIVLFAATATAVPTASAVPEPQDGTTTTISFDPALPEQFAVQCQNLEGAFVEARNTVSLVADTWVGSAQV